ncbi:hypothetical protein GGQ59_001139, partial [Parvularcula dongshanensis]|nr:hypothetical protein [Parvularcula dongshanensis]
MRHANEGLTAALLLGASALGLISPAAAQQASVPAPPQQAQ